MEAETNIKITLNLFTGRVHYFTQFYFWAITDGKWDLAQRKQPTWELRKRRAVAQAEPHTFLPYTTFIKFASIHVLISFSSYHENIPELVQSHNRSSPPGKAAGYLRISPAHFIFLLRCIDHVACFFFFWFRFCHYNQSEIRLFPNCIFPIYTIFLPLSLYIVHLKMWFFPAIGQVCIGRLVWNHMIYYISLFADYKFQNRLRHWRPNESVWNCKNSDNVGILLLFEPRFASKQAFKIWIVDYAKARCEKERTFSQKVFLSRALPFPNLFEPPWFNW